MEQEIVVGLLAELAECAQLLEQARGVVDRYEQRRGFLADLRQEYQDDAGDAEASGAQLDRQVRAQESEIRTLESKVDQKRQQLDLVRDNKEYKALRDEITSLETQIDTRETATLQLIENAERRQEKAAALRQESDDKQSELAQQLAELAADAEQAAARSEQLETEIERLLSMVPADVRATFSRLRQGVPLPAAYLDEAACGGCHAQFPAQEAIEIARGKKVIRCQACGRFVVPRNLS